MNPPTEQPSAASDDDLIVAGTDPSVPTVIDADEFEQAKKDSAATTPEPLRAEELRDAIGDILDICEGWGRPMTDEQKLVTIKTVATKAWENERE